MIWYFLNLKIQYLINVLRADLSEKYLNEEIQEKPFFLPDSILMVSFLFSFCSFNKKQVAITIVLPLLIARQQFQLISMAEFKG